MELYEREQYDSNYQCKFLCLRYGYFCDKWSLFESNSAPFSSYSIATSNRLHDYRRRLVLLVCSQWRLQRWRRQQQQRWLDVAMLTEVGRQATTVTVVVVVAAATSAAHFARAREEGHSCVVSGMCVGHFWPRCHRPFSENWRLTTTCVY